MTEPNLTGGSAQDRAEILKLQADYIDVNTRFDWENLQPLFSPAPEATFFNLNGHTYKGREHWTRLWQFYQNNVASSYWTPFDIGGGLFRHPATLSFRRRATSVHGGSGPHPAARPDRPPLLPRVRDGCPP